MKEEFEIIRKIGSGGNVNVYLVRWRGIICVGLKLRIDGISDEEKVMRNKRFENQFLFSQKLGNDESRVFPEIYGFLLRGIPPTYWIMMEKMEGDIGKLYSNRPRGWELAASILAPILRSLAIMHQQDVFHRDMKPDNILFNNSRIVLADLGLIGSPSIISSITPSGCFHGTMPYMHPMAFKNSNPNVDELTDLYGWFVSWLQIANGGLPAKVGSRSSCVADYIDGTYMAELLGLTPTSVRPGLERMFCRERGSYRPTVSDMAVLLSETYPALSEKRVAWSHLRAVLELASL